MQVTTPVIEIQINLSSKMRTIYLLDIYLILFIHLTKLITIYLLFLYYTFNT